MHDRKIMVLGDIVADVYLEGRISRISREAPVLVLENMGETVVPGGAANAVHNAATLGGAVYAVGVIGDDLPGQQVAALLQAKGVNTIGFIVDRDRPTISKMRVMAGGQATVRQQVVRIDKESKLPISTAIEQQVQQYATQCIREMSAVVISDYGSCTVTPAVRQTVLTECAKWNIPCIVDSRYHILDFVGTTLVKQNEAEAAAALGYESLDEIGVEAAGKALLEKLQAQAVLITQGPEGMTLVERSGASYHIPVNDMSEVFDVSGAGDTVVVTMMLAITAGASYLDAARLANIAASVVVRKPGTATLTPAELSHAVEGIDINS